MRLRKLPRLFSYTILALFAALPITAARAGFFVDDYEVDDVGTCNVESGIASAGNGDKAIYTAPACVARLIVPVEIGAEIQRQQQDGKWTNASSASAKVTFVPLTRFIGIGLSGEINQKTNSGGGTGANVNVPVTLDFGHGVRFNLNGGALYDAENRKSFGTWGAQVEWTVRKELALVAEVFAQSGPFIQPVTSAKPRFQGGLRISPADNIDVSVIYGRNLNGEDANWITLGLNVGFSVR